VTAMPGELQSSGRPRRGTSRSCQNPRDDRARNCAITPALFSFQWSEQAPTTQQGRSPDAAQPGRFTDPSSPRPSTTAAPKLGIGPRKRADTTGCRPKTTVDTARGYQGLTRPTRARAVPGATTARRATDDHPFRPSTRSARFMSARATSRACVANRPSTPYHVQLRPSCKKGYSFGTRAISMPAPRCRYGTRTCLSQYVEGGSGPELRRHQGAVRGRYLTTPANTPLASTGTSTGR